MSVLKKYKTSAVIASMSFVIWCCKSAGVATSSHITSGETKAKPTLVPDSRDVVAANAHWTGTTLWQLSQGYKLFSEKCTRCHDMKMPQDFSVDDWNDIYPGMSRRAHLDSTQYNLVYHYIITKRETMLAGK